MNDQQDLQQEAEEAEAAVMPPNNPWPNSRPPMPAPIRPPSRPEVNAPERAAGEASRRNRGCHSWARTARSA